MDPNATVPQGGNANFIPPPLEETPSVVPPPIVSPQEPQVVQASPAEPVVPILPMTSVDQPPAPPIPPVNPPPEVPAQKSSPIFAIALTVLLVAIIGLAGYFLYTKYLGGASNNEAANTVVTPAPVVVTPTPNPTVSWKTYNFQPLSLSLRVPSDLIVHTEEPNPGYDFTAYIQNYAFNSPPPEDGAYQLYLIWQKKPIVTQNEFQLLKNDLIEATIEDAIIDGYPAIKGQVSGERNRFATFIFKETSVISLFTSEPTQANKALTDQILSTIEFTEATPTASPKLNPTSSPSATIKP